MLPKMLLLCEDVNVVGAAFYIMEFKRGRIFKDTALKDAPKSWKAGMGVVLPVEVGTYTVDAAGKDHLTLADFKRAFFQLADVHTDDVKPHRHRVDPAYRVTSEAKRLAATPQLGSKKSPIYISVLTSDSVLSLYHSTVYAHLLDLT